jgi:lactobin A/cerein 7B family class IIb bacteriocin
LFNSYYVQSTGAGQFKWTWTTTETSGLVLGPLDFLDARNFYNAQFTIKSFSGVNNVQVLGSASGARTGATIKGWPTTSRALTAGMTINFNRVACNCGDGILQRLEECDLGASNGLPNSCCNSDCTLRPASFQCRAASGAACDAPDYCTGTSPICINGNYTDHRLCGTQDNGSSFSCAYCQPTSATCPAATDVCPVCANCSHGGTCTGTGVQTCLCTSMYTGPTCDVPNCSVRTDCTTCSTHPECGWCCKEQVCMQKNLTNNQPVAPATQCDPRYWRSNSTECVCNGARACLNNGTCDRCGDCQCVPPYGGSTCEGKIDCFGVLNGNAKNELCGCNGGNTTCIGCDGVPYGKLYDKCGVCGGDGTSCYKLCPYDNCADCARAENCGWCGGQADTDSNPSCRQIGVDDTSTCKQVLTNADDCGINLTTEEIVGITGGIIALIVIIVIVVVAALAAGGGYAGYKYWSKYRANMGAANTNPLYKEGTGSGNNPLFQDKASD